MLTVRPDCKGSTVVEGFLRIRSRAIRKIFSTDEGSGMVEFAIVAGVFTIMLLGIAEYGLAAWQKNSVAADAREGARYASVRGSRSQTPASVDMIRAYVRSRTSLAPSAVRVYAEWEDVNKTIGKYVIVRVAHSVPRRGPFIPAHTDSAVAKVIILY